MHEGTEEDKSSMLNNTCSTSEPENDEQVHLSLLVSHHSDDEEISESKPFSSSELQLAFKELHDEYSQRSIFASVGKQYVTVIDYCNGVIDYRETLFEKF
ncbi:hypothetical protein Lal_00033392 [Lupinus albus]|nr:hypothetical protein Lal_00033392 [Lupinus albus]